MHVERFRCKMYTVYIFERIFDWQNEGVKGAGQCMEITAGMIEPVIQLVNFFQAVVEVIFLYDLIAFFYTILIAINVANYEKMPTSRIIYA